MSSSDNRCHYFLYKYSYFSSRKSLICIIFTVIFAGVRVLAHDLHPKPYNLSDDSLNDRFENNNKSIFNNYLWRETKMVKTQKGFTLIELMIVIAIIGILAAVAVPQYGQYTKRAKFAEVVTQTAAAKTAVTLCFQEEGSLNTCSSGDYAGIPDDITAQTGLVESMFTVNGEITATGHADQLNALTYILTPTPMDNNTRLLWAVNAGSTCIGENLCKAN